MSAFIEEISLRANDQAQGVLGKVDGALEGLTSRLLSAAGVLGAGFGFSALVKDGLDFNRTLEDTNLGIASVLGTLQKYTGANGAALEGVQKFTAAQADATRVQEQLKNAALLTTASYEQMVEAYQVGVGPMLRGKIAMTDTVEATQRLTQAAGALGVPMAQLGIEMRQFFEGDFARSRLLQGLNITGEQVRTLAASGGLMDLLREKTDSMSIAGERASQSMTGLISNVKDFISQAMGQGVEELYSTIKSVLGEISGLFGHVEGQSFVFNEGLIDSLKAVGNSVAGVFSMAWETTKGFFGKITEGLASNGLTWGDVFRSVGIVAVESFGIIQKAALYIAEEIAHPFDQMKGRFATLFSGILAYASEAAEKMSKIPILGSGMAEWADSLNKASVALSNTEPAKKYASVVGDINTKVDAQVKSWTSLIGAMDATGDADSNLHHELATTSTVIKQMNDEQKKLTESFEKFAASTKLGLASAGLTGYEKGLSDIEKKYGELNLKLDEWQKKMGKAGLASPMIAELKKLGDTAKENDLGKLQEDAAKKYNAAMDGILKYTTTTAEARLAVEQKTALDRIDTELKVAVSFAKTDSEVVRVTLAAAEAIRAINKETADKSVMLNTGQKNDWSAMWSTLVTRAREGAITIQEAYGQLAQKLAKDGTTVADGFLLGFAEIKAKAPTIVHATADLVGGIWQAQGDLFTSVFTNVLTGDFQGLKGTVEGFGKSIAGIFAKYFSEILQSWLLSKIGIEQNPITGKMQMSGGGQMNADGSIMGGTVAGAWGNAAGGIVGGGVTGYGVGSAIGGTSGAPGFNTGATIGGAAGGAIVAGLAAAGVGFASGSAAGPIGMIIGAIIGGLIGVLSAPNTEKRMFIAGNLISPNSKDAASGSILATRDLVSSSIVDIFGSTSKDGRGVFAKSLNTAISNYIKGISFEAHAGQNEDLQADFRQILSGVIPREMLNQLFGAHRVGGQDMAGISGASKYSYDDYTTRDKEGNTTVHSGFGETVVTKWLQGLGFTVNKIKEIGSQIDQKEPEAFLQYLNSLVGIVVGFGTAKDKLGMGTDATLADITSEQNKTAVSGFMERAQNLKDLSAELANYTGDAQIQKAQALLGLANQYYQDQRAYLTNLMQLAKDINSSIEDQKRGIRYSLLGTEGQKSFLQAEMEGFQRELLGTTDPSRVKELVAKIQADAGALFNLYGADSPDRTAVANSLIAMLDYVNSIAQEKIRAEEEAVIGANAGLPDVMEANKRLFTDVNGALGPLPANITATSTAFDTAASSASRLATVFDRLSDRMMQAFNTQAAPALGGGSTTGGGGGLSYSGLRTYGSEMATRTA